MLRWLGPRKAQVDSPDGRPVDPLEASGEVTDDPLATINISNKKRQKIYSVSRSVLLLPRVAVKNGDTGTRDTGGGVNPLYDDNLDSSTLKHSKDPQQKKISRQSYPPSGEKSYSSGYGGSHGEGSSHEPTYGEKVRLRDEVVSVLEQNSNYVKSIQVVTTGGKNNRSVPSLVSGSSGAGTLTTIPEGKVDIGIPKPIWPKFNENLNELRRQGNSYDSLVDEALLLYTSVNYVPTDNNEPIYHVGDKDVAIKEILVDLSNCISATMEGKNGVSPEQMLKCIKDKIAASLDILKNSTEEEMRKLCINMSNRKKVTSVIKAFSNSSSSGNSSQSSPEFNSVRVRTISADTEDIYQVPSGSSSSGFSDSIKHYGNMKRLPPQEDLALNPDGMRNAIIYGTLCRANVKVSTKSGNNSANEKLLDNESKSPEKTEPKKSLLQASSDSKPSVWQQYYGVNIAQEAGVQYMGKPTDVPLYPGGRPEADFTLDVPRSELLSKRMKEDKKWRCRCRLLTSFLGLVFFLLSVMLVSLMLTRGRRMFGSMV